jgi:hypothetical protein
MIIIVYLIILKGLLQGASELEESRENAVWTVREIAERFRRYYIDHPEARQFFPVSG